MSASATIASGTYAGTRVTWALHADKMGGLDFESEVNSPTVPSAANPAVTSNRHYLSAGGQVIGVLVTTGALPTLAAGDTAPPVLASVTAVKLEYWHKDHLGSTAATTDHTGALTARYAYDPFGKRRSANGSYDAAGAIVVDWSPAVNNGNDRGFTGHEHLDDVGLVHMNGRVFDPRLGVFLQADPMTQDPFNLQGYNRYGYCYNNPLTCTDPSGLSSWTDFRDGFVKPALLIAFAVVAGPVVYEQVFWLAVSSGLTGSAVTAVAGFASGAVIGAAQGVLYGGDIDDVARSALRGGFSASAFAVGGDAITGSGSFFNVGQSGLPTPAAVAIHGVVGCVTSVAGGAKCGPGAASAAFSKFATVSGAVGDDIVSGTITSAVIGGTAAELGGGKFANGAMTAAFAYLFNECQHTRRCSDWMYTGDNTRVLAVETGIVSDVGWQDPNNPNAGFGFRIKVTSIDQQRTWIYAHMDPDTPVFVDMLVSRGDQIGNYAVPANGNSTGPHLHLEVRGRSTNQPILNQGDVFPIPGGRMTSPINPNRIIVTNNGQQTRPHNGSDWVGGP